MDEIGQRFRHDLVELRLRAGQPSYSALETASKHLLRRATVSDRLTGRRPGVPDWPFVFTFVNACRAAAESNGIDLEDLGTVADWKQHWDAAKRGIIDVRFPGRSRQQAQLGQALEDEHATADTLDELREQRSVAVPREGDTVWGSIPRPVNNFVGRGRFLDNLHRIFLQDDRTGALAIHGVAGIGKTQVAAEYARLHRSEYDLVWWISCDTKDDARASMSELASRIGVTEPSQVSGENEFNGVFDKLRLSRKYANWLLIFDGANDPEEIRRLIPPDRQNVLITSRNYEWGATDTLLELDVLKRKESVEFLRERRLEFSEVEAHQLADALGDLPLALEHAVESPVSVVEYLDRLEKDTIHLFSGNPPSAYPDTIADTWRKIILELCAETPDAMALLVRLAFFGSDPVPRDCMDRKRSDQAVSLDHILRDPVRFTVAIQALGRAGLLRSRPSLRAGSSMFHVHKLTQCIIRGWLSVAEQRLSMTQQKHARHDVHLLLAAADPANPDNSDSWGQYEELRGHMDASGVVGSKDNSARFLVINFVRYLCAVGDPRQALRRADEALERWASGVRIEESGPEDIVLAMYRAKVEVLCSLGRFDDALDVCDRTLAKMRSAARRWPEEITALGRLAGTRLRKEGDFAKALAADIQSRKKHSTVLGRNHPQTFMAMHNLCIDHSLKKKHVEALNIADEAYRLCDRFYGRPDHPSTLFHQNALARCQRLAGNYEKSLEMMSEVDARYSMIAERNILREDHPWCLLHSIDLAATRRDKGLKDDAELESLTEEMYHIYLRCWQTLSPDHPLTLAAAIMRGTLLRRIPNRLGEADILVSETRQRYSSTLGQGHPYTEECGTLLADIRQQLGSARQLRRDIEPGYEFTPLPL